MNLREYLFKERMTVTDFAKKIGISRGHLTSIMNGKYKPSKPLSKLIEISTDHQVTENNIKS